MIKTYTQNIEQILIDHFEIATKSIVIVVAWFTNKKLIDKLIDLRRRKKIDIKILVDDNYTNQKYFFDLFLENLLKVGIEIKRQKFPKFNHNKFSIIDDDIFITGSYNYTARANRNLENIAIIKDDKVANHYKKIFNFFTKENYRDENINILTKNFDFANKLISTYYPFSNKLFCKLKEQICLGYCFTHENGFYNEIVYEAGLIFNPKFTLHKELKKFNKLRDSYEYDIQDIDSNLNQEFDLPITKDLIMSYKLNEIREFNYETSREIANYDLKKIDFQDLEEIYEMNEIALTKYYTRKFDLIYSIDKLNVILKNEVDIIIEDHIWINHFAPFLSDKIVEEIYICDRSITNPTSPINLNF